MKRTRRWRKQGWELFALVLSEETSAIRLDNNARAEELHRQGVHILEELDRK